MKYILLTKKKKKKTCGCGVRRDKSNTNKRTLFYPLFFTLQIFKKIIAAWARESTINKLESPFERFNKHMMIFKSNKIKSAVIIERRKKMPDLGMGDCQTGVASSVHDAPVDLLELISSEKDVLFCNGAIAELSVSA